MNGPNPAHEPVSSPSGIIVVDKPLRITSARVVSIVKGRLKAGGAPKRVKVGHAGTLDPLASGVLVVLVGKATKLQDRAMGAAKRYTAEIDLSCVSETDDLEFGAEPVPVDHEPNRPELEDRLRAQFTGVIRQAPPAYSAIKVAGKRAFDLAREGEAPKLEPRPVRIDAIDILSYTFPMLTIDVRCGKGTYIRSLARDIGRSFDAGGVLTALRRTAVGPFTIEASTPLDDVPSPLLQEHLISLDLARELLD